MNGRALLKEVIRYQWYDVLFDRFYSREYSDLPVNDLWQDIAKRITFSWGLGVSGGICILLFILTLQFAKGLLLIPILLGFAVIALLLSSIASCFYLYFRMRRHYLDEAHLKQMEEEGYGELHGELDRSDAPTEDPPNDNPSNDPQNS